MDGQTQSYNSERKLEISSKISQLLETLDRKLQEMARKIKGNIKNMDHLNIYMELLDTGGKEKTFSINTGRVSLMNYKGEYIGKCHFTADDLLTDNILCNTTKKNKSYEIKSYELRDIGKIIRDLSNIINEEKNSPNSSYWLIFYADIANYLPYSNPRIVIEKEKSLLDNADIIMIYYSTFRSHICLRLIPLPYSK
jgi:hypothetical protein